MKVLDVQNLHSGIDELIKKVGNQKKDIQDVGAAVHSFAALEDSFNGKGGKAIRSFYEECHSPFLLFYQQFLASYEQMLKQIKSSLQSLEPLESGYIHESFLLNNLEEGLQQTKKMTALLTEEANDSIRSVRDIIPLSTLQADDFLEDIYQAQKYRNTTMEKLYAFDKQQAFILSETTHDLYQMRKYIQDIQSQFQSGAWSITGYEAGQLSESGITFVAAAEKPNVTAPASEEILACEAPVAEKEKVDNPNNFLLEGASRLLNSVFPQKTLIEVITGKDFITEKDIKLTKKQRSLILDFVPFISNVKAAIETITEKDYITKEELTTAEWVIGGVSILAGPIGKAGKWIFKGGSELVANIPKYADTIAEQFKKVQHVLNPENIKSVMDDAYKKATKLVRGIPGKVQEMKQSILDSLPSIAPDVVMAGGGAVDRTAADIVEEATEQIYTFAKNIKNEAKATVNEVKSLFSNIKDKGKTKGTDEINYTYFNKTHKDSLPKPKGDGPNGGKLQSHHGLQQEWAKNNLSQYGYNYKLAPTITIETGKGLPHTIINNAQTARRNERVASGVGKWSTTLQEELQFAVEDLTKAGFSRNTISQVLEQQYKMLDKLGVKYERIDY
ncbi:T7SS effector LXG polymorphic toxin [Metabacillus fastidiosus]|nr:T7SS effector LXG polymorphic toxin [Metabacillus fastidiosus]